MKLLTIAIPTYNRAANLELLLRCLRTEVSALKNEVTVLVSDNASSDDTPRVLRDAQRDWAELTVRRNEQNIGADGNFCEILDRIDSRYFWVLGDDDLPKTGVISKLIALLLRESPALVYMQSEWVKPIIGPDQGTQVGELRFDSFDRADFAKRVHIWCTFISGMLVDHQQLMRGLNGQSVRRFSGTSLVQLGWVYPVLKSGSKFLFVRDQCVLATRDNTGGYGLLTVFGVNFSRVSREAFDDQPDIAKSLIERGMMRYLPGLIWSSRKPGDQRFDKDNPWPGMRRELGSKAMFWALLVPIGRLPRIVAMPFYLASRIMNRVAHGFDNLLARRRRRKFEPVSSDA
ncbi:MAG: glycosyltransferase family 2 protein [Burkholderiales bacterium]